jgi:FHA domain
MPKCPKGHDSVADDYCDECGALIRVAAGPGIANASGAAGVSGESAATQKCPICGSSSSGRFCEEDGYDFVLLRPTLPAPAAIAPDPAAPLAPAAPLEAAPPNSAAPQPPYGLPATEHATRIPGGPGVPPAAPAAAKPWVAVVTADRDYFETIIAQSGPDAASVTFPAVCPERRIPLTGREMVIGRHSASRGLNPHIDLSGPPEDPGVSHLHAVLQSTPDGGWTITDPGSTNGTTINDDPQPIKVGVPVPIYPGDRIHVGAWTTLTLTQPQPPGTWASHDAS